MKTAKQTRLLRSERTSQEPIFQELWRHQHQKCPLFSGRHATLLASWRQEGSRLRLSVDIQSPSELSSITIRWRSSCGWSQLSRLAQVLVLKPILHLTSVFLRIHKKWRGRNIISLYHLTFHLHLNPPHLIVRQFGAFARLSFLQMFCLTSNFTALDLICTEDASRNVSQ